MKDHVFTIMDSISPPDEIIGAPLGHTDGKVDINSSFLYVGF